jgi:ABC-type branched-subunit amino acid transport system substrate-binding protein
MTETPIKVGMIAELTGPLAFMGLANANVATMTVEDINASGGLLGRRLDLIIEDGATNDSVASAAAAKLVKDDKVDVIFGGIFSSTRQAIKGPAVEEGKTIYIYPEQYEGQEYHPLLFCTGPVPAQQVEPLVPWLMRETGAKKVFLPSADYIWPRATGPEADRDEQAEHRDAALLWQQPARARAIRQGRLL